MGVIGTFRRHAQPGRYIGASKAYRTRHISCDLALLRAEPPEDRDKHRILPTLKAVKYQGYGKQSGRAA